MNDLWNDALQALRSRLSAENFETWLLPVECGQIEGDRLTLRIPNRFHGEWISAHYLQLIVELIRERTQTLYKIEWEVDEKLQEKARAARQSEETKLASSPPPPPVAANDSVPSDLSPKYRFDNFIVGPSNQLAHAASVAAASDPGKRYNPLFIYGGVGLGKTHLANAIGHKILEDRPASRIHYISAERFTNEFIWSLRNHRIDEFRRRYREECDVLLMDDIQFLAGREQTQEEFFHTFNALYHSDRQIVVTCDVFPERIPEMQERLISRFQSGLVADTQPPELDTRIAILHKKAEQEKIPLPNDVALYLAQEVKSNVRELEGTLLRLAVKADLLGQPIHLALVQHDLKGSHSSADPRSSVEEIQRIVCEHFNIKLADLKSHRRHRAVSFPRMVAMYLCRRRLGVSYPELGERFGGKDHTTVLSAVRKIGHLIESDPSLRSVMDTLERKLG